MVYCPLLIMCQKQHLGHLTAEPKPKRKNHKIMGYFTFQLSPRAPEPPVTGVQIPLAHTGTIRSLQPNFAQFY